ncbi:MAG: hypothetical protein R8P61_01065 [Bacteroidia bacterium]|nr:hypothetical protein [Bacteroidia bacterium]
MKIKFMLVALCLSFLLTDMAIAQKNPFLKKLERKAKRKLEQRAERKADKAMDKGLDKVEDGLDKSVKKNKDKKKESTATASESASATMEGSAQNAPEAKESKPAPLTKEEVSSKESRTPMFGGGEEPKPFTENNFGNEAIREEGSIGKGPFGIASGRYIQISRTQANMMESVERDTVTFAQHGNLQERRNSSRRKIDMMGIKRNEEGSLHIIHLNDSIYSLDRLKGKGHVMKNPSKQIYQGMSEAQMQDFAEDIQADMNTKRERLGTDRVAGKLCEVLEFTTYTEDGKLMMITRLWWWRGMLMKTHSRGMGTEIQQEITEIQADISVNSRVFRPNPKVKYRSFSFGNY